MENPLCKNLFLTFAFFLCTSPFFAQAFKQELILHESNGKSYTFYDHVSDSSDLYNFENVTRVCSLGAWWAYEGADFSVRGSSLGVSETMVCTSRSFPFKSFRYTGASETEESAVSLYPSWGPEYFLREGTSMGGISEIQEHISSFAITGSSKWLFFEGANFSGKSACAERGHILGLYSLQFTLKLSTVGSVWEGCNFEKLQRYKETLEAKSH